MDQVCCVSRNVEKLYVSINCAATYRFPDVFYLSSSLEQLTMSVELDTFPRCKVSWKSLRTLKLRRCSLIDQSLADILSGCPILETLMSLVSCGWLPERLDLSKSPSLKRLEIDQYVKPTVPMEIIAPHIRYLRLRIPEEPYTLMDVSSLTEANLDIYNNRGCVGIPSTLIWKADFLQKMVLKMLTELQNVERLTFNGTFLQILSLAELRGVLFPTLEVQTLTVRTKFARSVIPGIQRLLQNSPGLKKLIAEATDLLDIADRDLDRYLHLQGLNPDQCWRSKYGMFPTSYEFNWISKRALSKLVASFMEMLLRNVNALRTLVGLECIHCYDANWLIEFLQMPSNNNNVSIVFKR